MFDNNDGDNVGQVDLLNPLLYRSAFKLPMGNSNRTLRCLRLKMTRSIVDNNVIVFGDPIDIEGHNYSHNNKEIMGWEENIRAELDKIKNKHSKRKRLTIVYHIDEDIST